ncbi:hypothetical protein J8F10_24095 [Gemmata sp. G18]|uniref:Uncharacterized protein n=1 Tax=Gemmata palustris TaxID=2822762 RepID=A0ABS5BX78_9BACT|nr:hypothetical protein [Gemmata palustris]MBP3958342.1 hypothetical protein [Gemmata palustris]
MTDIGGGALFISTGTIWKPVGGSCVLASSSVSGVSVTGTTSETTLATVTIPAGLMTANGALRVRTLWSYTNSGNNKVPRMRLGGIGGTVFMGPTFTTTASAQIDSDVRNRGAANSQVSWNFSSLGIGSSTGAPTTGSVDTATAQDLVFTGQLTNTGETITLESYRVELVIP